jgi:hypothetical protein
MAVGGESSGRRRPAGLRRALAGLDNLWRPSLLHARSEQPAWHPKPGELNKGLGQSSLGSLRAATADAKYEPTNTREYPVQDKGECCRHRRDLHHLRAGADIEPRPPRGCL